MSRRDHDNNAGSDDEREPEHGSVSRRTLIGGAAATTGAALLATSQGASAFAANHSQDGSVNGAPDLSREFTRTFKSRMVRANGIRQHVVIGGNGPPLLLVHGWPESWYAWRLMMPALAKQYTVIAVDQRGIGMTDKPPTGYDAATLANDLAGLMGALGFSKYAVMGHDTGYVISYALAADHRDQVTQLVVAEIPGPPGVDPEHPLGPPYFVPNADNNRLWHIAFNRVDSELIIDMVRTNADGYYRYEFAIQGGGVPDKAIRYYINLYTRNREVLRGSFGFYRAWFDTLSQNLERVNNKLTIPVLGIGGALSYGGAPATVMEHAATNVQGVIIPGVGHWVAEQAPAVMVQTVTDFLAP